MPPRKKAVPADPPTTRTVRSSARLASQAIAVAANSDTTTTGDAFNPSSNATIQAPPKPKPASSRGNSKSGSKRTKADTDGNESDLPAPKKLKSVTVDEKDEDAMDMVVTDDKRDSNKDKRKMVTSKSC